MTDQEWINAFFPECDPKYNPFGNRVLVQLKLVRKKTAGGIVLVEETQEINRENTCLAKIVACGPTAFRDNSGKQWYEGAWAIPGQIVHVPKWGGFRFSRTINGEEIYFSLVRDHELIGAPTGDVESIDKIL